jgi:DNA-binding SARP family transcriptional activator/tetratricopeptide (TPR) repeat protein
VVEFRVLGAVEVAVGGVRLDVGHARQCDVLTVLLLDAGRVVPVERLVERVWGDRPPRRPKNSLYSYLSRLRDALAAAEGVTIERHRGGYVLLADPLTVDVHRFDDLIGRAKAADDDHAALALYDEALALWRGRPLGELRSPWADDRRSELARRRDAAVLDRNDRRLRTGGHADVLAEPRPDGVVDERVAAQRLEALFLDGRPADALREYERIRASLAEELGADPGPRLRGLHERILTGREPDAGPPVPRQLPAAPASFTGRADELATLDRLLAPEGAVVVIAGAGGLGKTWLALRWATAHAARFPDGQLHADLRGFDPAGEPVSPGTAVRGFLSALGVAAGSIPPGLEAQTALYRSLTAERRMLVVLDNVRDTAQAAPLLPGGSACSVLLTSRHELGGLLTTHGARAVPLRTLDERGAGELLAAKLGAARLTAEPAAGREIVRQCGGLALALAIIAARADAQPGLRLSALAAELTEARLDALDAEELSASLRAVFAASYRALDPRTASAFRLLALVPDTDLGRGAATAMLGDARPLRALCAANLLQEGPPGRFRMHDLVKLYAAELGAGTDSAETRLAAVTRLFDHYLHWASAAMDHWAPHEPYLRPPVPPSEGPQPPFTGYPAARDWLDTESSAMLALAAQAPDPGLGEHVVRLSAMLWRYLEVGARYHEALALHTGALARTRPGERAHGTTHQAVGMTLFRLGRYDEALGHFEQALLVAREHRSDLLENMVRNGFASVYDMRGRREEARQQYELALAAARRTGHPLLEGITLCNLGEHYHWCGAHHTAIRHLERSAEIALELASAGLGGWVLLALGNAHAGLGHDGEAAEHFRRALANARAGRNTNLEVAILNDLGDTKTGTGAIELYQEALTLAQRIGHLHESARAHHGLAKVHHSLGHRTEAEPHLEAALIAYTELSAPEADELRTLLTTPSRPTGQAAFPRSTGDDAQSHLP